MSAKNVPFDGSSPRMRGARVIVLIQWKPIRIIPADAGSTRGPLPARSWTPDHPRGCGEHVAGEEPHMLLVGSSPRMRGALYRFAANEHWFRIIPADAGSTPV